MGKYRKLEEIPGYTRSEVVSFLREKLRIDKAYALRALEVLYNRQTDYEKSMMKTSIDNNIGFSSTHAPRLMFMYKQYKKYKTITDLQLKYLMSVIWHYAEQLVEISDPIKLLNSLDLYYKDMKPPKDIEVEKKNAK